MSEVDNERIHKGCAEKEKKCSWATVAYDAQEHTNVKLTRPSCAPEDDVKW